MIALIDYGAGNLTSVKKALSHLNAPFNTPSSPDELAAVSGIIVPGVGNFEATNALTKEWKQALKETIDRNVPLLGICLGLQWLFEGSEESQDVAGLGLLTGNCSLIHAEGDQQGQILKVPHVGWNSLHITRESWLLRNICEGDQVYFTHSYAAPVTDACVASTDYGFTFASAIEHQHVAGVQFHPEKSGRVGLSILNNFLSLTK
tara:strand:- start:2200 stop:2814 length:615 start_codon:yes stop_codon:yes gene_type:complete